MPNVATRFQPDISGSAVPSGFIGEELTASGIDVATNTSSNTTIATLTLTTGAWLVSATSESRAAASQTGAVHLLYIKGTNSTAKAKDYIQCLLLPAGSSHAVTFASRIVNIASSDATKTVYVAQLSATAAGLGCAFITAVRIA